MATYVDATNSQRAVARKLADMASYELTRYWPRYLVTKDAAGRVWHLMTATRQSDGAQWAYELRRDAGSYAGDFPAV
jgi:hypothetical protein